MSLMLTRVGYNLDAQSGIWSRAGYDGISYSDGDEVEQRIGCAVGSARDLSTLSEELREHCKDWPSLYHLSALRANILRPFERHLGADVLEIGAGCGAITRYLGECGGEVLALEGSPRRAAIARSRTRDLSNVTVVADRFDNFRCGKTFSVVTLIGVLEYANLFSSGSNPALAMLERARSFLKPDGILLLAIENQLGLKYFAGAAEDHVGRAMYGIEGRYRADQPQTFGRKVLANLLARAGYSASSFLAPFPDYKLPISIVAESGFLTQNFDAAALAWQSVRHDPQMPSLLAFSPELVWPTIAENGLALDLSNSFLVAAQNGARPVEEPSDLAWHYSTNRRKPFCKETRFVREDAGRIEVRYRLLGAPDEGEADDGGLLRFKVPEKAAYMHGRPLSQEITEILSRDGWTLAEVVRFFQRYLGILEEMLSRSSENEARRAAIDSPDRKLPGSFFDRVPHNIIVAPDGAHYLIDEEWDLSGGITAGFLVFRSLVNIISVTSRIGQSEEVFEATPLGLLKVVFEALQWPMRRADFISYAETEASIQVAVQGGSGKLEQLLKWLIEGTLVRENLVQNVEDEDKRSALLRQTILQRDDELATLGRAILQSNARVTELSRAVSDSDARVAELNRAIWERDTYIADLLTSSSWRMTAPLRFVRRQISRAHRTYTLLPGLLAHGEGIRLTTFRAIRVLRREGLAGLRTRLRGLEVTASRTVDTKSKTDSVDLDD